MIHVCMCIHVCIYICLGRAWGVPKIQPKTKTHCEDEFPAKSQPGEDQLPSEDELRRQVLRRQLAYCSEDELRKTNCAKTHCQAKTLHLLGKCDLRSGIEPQGRVPGNAKTSCGDELRETNYWAKANYPATPGTRVASRNRILRPNDDAVVN